MVVIALVVAVVGVARLIVLVEDCSCSCALVVVEVVALIPLAIFAMFYF
jgi:hypothetical protein